VTLVRTLFGFLAVAALVAAAGCGADEAAGRPVGGSTAPAQALRKCVDRWNQGNMLGWGPTLVNVSIRRLTADQLAAVGLRNPALRRCTVSLAVHSRRDPTSGCSGEAVMPVHPEFCVYRGRTYVCVINRFGGYGCPTNAEGSPPLRRRNAATDEHGTLKLDVPLKDTHPTPPLEWQRRYPHVDGWIEPWTRAGRLRPDLRLTGSYHGSCSRGSQQTRARTAGRCVPLVNAGFFDPCFARRARWSRRGTVVACANWPGETTFSRFVITKLR
jgi:hypothetical protein